LPRTLHGQLIEQAQREGTSLNQFLLYVITSNTSGQVIASAVVEKLMATASLAPLNTSISQAGEFARFVANTHSPYSESSLARRIFVADVVNQVDVVTYGATPKTIKWAGATIKELSLRNQGRVKSYV